MSRLDKWGVPRKEAAKQRRIPEAKLNRPLSIPASVEKCWQLWKVQYPGESFNSLVNQLLIKHFRLYNMMLPDQAQAVPIEGMAEGNFPKSIDPPIEDQA